MPMRDGIRGKIASSLLEPLSRNGDVNSVGLSVQEGDSLSFLVHVGDTVDAGFLAVIEEGDTLGGAYTVAGANDIIGDIVKNTADTVFKLGYVGNKAFARVALTIPGVTKCGVTGINGHLHRTAEADKT